MDPSRRLAAVSTAQLGFGLAGLATAVQRGHAFDIPGWKGRPDRVAADALTMGTALSAPAPMLVAQIVATAQAARGDSRWAPRVLGGLGAAMTIGYPIERLVRRRLTPAGWEPLETPVALGGMALAVVMAAAAFAVEKSPGNGTR